LLFFAYQHIRPSAVAKNVSVGLKTADGSLGEPSPESSEGHHLKYATAAEYITAHTPRVAARPWSAPIYDDRKVTSNPEVYCMISGADKFSTCHCYTEEATPYREKLDDVECRSMAVWGVYNPYRVVSRPSSDHQQQDSQHLAEKRTDAPASTAAASGHSQVVGASGEFGAMTHYGQMHGDSPAPDTTYPGGLQ
jgi:hypothetical protein